MSEITAKANTQTYSCWAESGSTTKPGEPSIISSTVRTWDNKTTGVSASINKSSGGGNKQPYRVQFTLSYTIPDGYTESSTGIGVTLGAYWVTQ